MTVEGLALPDGARPGPNCGVTAVAIAAQLPFDVVYREFAKRHSGQWRGGTNYYERNAIMNHFGVKYIIDNSWRKGSGYLAQKPNLRKWAKLYMKRDTLYMVTTRGHVQMVYNGVVTDQAGPRLIEDCTLAGRKVHEVLIIERDNVKTAPVQKKETKISVTEYLAGPRFSNGTSVSFYSRDGRKHEGRIIKMNPKRAKVMTDRGVWNVPYAAMKAIEYKKIGE